MEIDLNKPAFGPSAEPSESLEEPNAFSDGEGVEQNQSGSAEPEENKVPYTRFKKFHDKALAAEKEAMEWKARYEAINKPEPASEPNNDDDWDDWVEAYGDSDASRRMYDREMKRRQQMFQSIEERAISALENKRKAEAEAMAKNLEVVDDGLDDLSSYLGRDLTDSEQSELLDIVDEYTPKDDDGNYLGGLMPFDKAWEIYEMKKEYSTSGRRNSRNRIAGISGAQSQGQPSQKDVDANYNPQNWGNWRNRFN